MEQELLLGIRVRPSVTETGYLALVNIVYEQIGGFKPFKAVSGFLCKGVKVFLYDVILKGYLCKQLINLRSALPEFFTLFYLFLFRKGHFTSNSNSTFSSVGSQLRNTYVN